ncbi:hypothetical protein [Planotetraspora sp. GP83]|uniref:hypothetical protein n=1 Tax=Planotetraspora sp. GP83 TaxID=3156264 RepID=UPI0035195393
MRRFVALNAALISAVLIAVSVPAEAAEVSTAERPADTLAKLRAQLVAGHGVKVVERRWTYIDHKLSPTVDWIEGVLQFNRSGVAGYDVRVKSGPMSGRIRSLAIGPYTYQSGGSIAQSLPKGKKWRRMPSKPGRRSPFLTQMMIVEPATMKAVLATTTHYESGVYRGAITLGRLYAVSPSYHADVANKPDARESELTINWLLATNSKGLPSYLVTKLADPDDSLGYVARNSEVLFTFWGKKVDLTPPPLNTINS